MNKPIFSLIVTAVLYLTFSYAIGLLSGTSRTDVLRRADAKRISDLREIAHKVNLYWTDKGRLPASLNDVSLPSDSAQPYIYRVTDQHNYQLCAQFDRSTGVSPQFAAGHFWSHPSGTQCINVVLLPAKR